MLSEAVRKYSRKFLEPLARFLSATGVSPNVVSIIGFILMVGVAIVLAKGYLFLGGILIIVAGIFDAIDGTLARMMERTSRFGAFLDSTLDRFSEAIIYLGLFIYFIGQNQQMELILIYATVVGSLMVSYALARAESINVPLKDGLFTRFERIAEGGARAWEGDRSAGTGRVALHNPNCHSDRNAAMRPPGGRVGRRPAFRRSKMVVLRGERAGRWRWKPRKQGSSSPAQAKPGCQGRSGDPCRFPRAMGMAPPDRGRVTRRRRPCPAAHKSRAGRNSASLRPSGGPWPCPCRLRTRRRCCRLG